jgi:hypothetical protein
MTAQIPDTLHIDGVDFDMIAVRGEGLFEPTVHGLCPKPPHTALWRGFLARYTLMEDRLVLDGLDACLDRPSALFGIPPAIGPDGTLRYDGLEVFVRFTGGIVAATGFLEVHYVHSGFQLPHAFEKVLELTFESGVLSAKADRSDDLRRIRESMARDPSAFFQDSTLARVRGCLRHDYGIP